jgi:hypothetical protein
MDKRKERRFKQLNRASIVSASGPRSFSDQAGINACTYDVSLNGAKLYSDVDFPVGTLLRMHVDMVRSGDSIGIDGVVRWSKWNAEGNTFELGLEFSHLIPRTAVVLMQNLYDQSPGIPTRLTERGHPAGRKGE